ncbi:MAG: 4-hydroxy-tetrahydrodipicolinate synthase, partial [Rickettsiales bacterium]|nr:4-hydroxy-tetrahydrodipicolinate synthase [Rickettsiales bacterium]
MSDFSLFSGCYTALITPFKGDGVDVAAFEQFVEWQIGQGVHGLVPCGTTGESPTLTPAEHGEVIARAVAISKGRVKIMAGTGSNSTAEAIEYTKHAEKVGADAALVVSPYYNKPTQEGLYQHFKAVAAATRLPIFIYNIPGRSVVNMTDVTLARLAEIKNIAGLKDATGDLARVATLRHLVGDRLVQFSGEDMTAVGFNAMGGRGVISVASNLAPKISAEVQNLSLTGKHEEARALHAQLVPLINAMFVETNPMPVKFALSLMKKTDG